MGQPFNPLKAVLPLFFLAFSQFAKAQAINSDSLFSLARIAVFDEKKPDKAKALLQQLLKQSPDYIDASVFLARIFAWNKDYDSSRNILRQVLQKRPSYTDASVALADVEYWNDNNTAALQVLDSGLIYQPSSVELLNRKAKVLIQLDRTEEAKLVLNQVLKVDPANQDATTLKNKIVSTNAKNSVGLSYDYVHFDKQFADPWQLISVDYTRRTKYGSLTPRMNYANRFRQNGYQIELDAYPKISKTFYSYVNVGFSDNVGIFPQWRFGASLYANLPKSYEAELGLRYLYFSDPTIIYTAYAGKYYKSFLFGLRAYLTPGNTSISQSYNASARYYFAGADDFIGLSIGTGISPDERILNTQIASSYNLKTVRAGINGRFSVVKLNVFTYNISLNNQEYLPGEKDNQVQAGIGYIRRF